MSERIDRRRSIGGSDARIIMGDDEGQLIRLWREKRGEIEPEDLSDNLIVQLGTVTEDLNRRWYQFNTACVIKDVQKRIQHPVNKWMSATLDGIVHPTGAVFEAKFMLPWTFSEEGAAEKHMAQLQHNMWVSNARSAVLSIITGGGKWVEMNIHADPLYQHLLITAERKFWRCVQTGEIPRLFGIEPPRPRLAAVRIVDMSGSNAWAELAASRDRDRPPEHEAAKADLKKLVPEDAKEAIGHGLRAKRSKSGAISFDLVSCSESPAGPTDTGIVRLHAKKLCSRWNCTSTTSRISTLHAICPNLIGQLLICFLKSGAGCTYFNRRVPRMTFSRY